MIKTAAFRGATIIRCSPNWMVQMSQVPKSSQKVQEMIQLMVHWLTEDSGWGIDSIGDYHLIFYSTERLNRHGLHDSWELFVDDRSGREFTIALWFHDTSLVKYEVADPRSLNRIEKILRRFRQHGTDPRYFQEKRN